MSNLKLSLHALTLHLEIDVDRPQVLRIHAQANLPLTLVDLRQQAGRQGLAHALAQGFVALVKVLTQIQGL